MPRKTSTTKKTTRRKKKTPELIEETESKMENVEQAANEQAATEEVMEEALAAVKAESEDIQTETEAEEKPKPKRRAPARKRSTKKASMDSVAVARAKAEEEEEEEERPAYAPTFSERIEEMRDIKPKQTADATFLIPEKFSFDLIDKKRRAKKSGWVKKSVYILGGLIIILAIALIAMTMYSNHLLSQESDLASLTNNDQNAGAAQVSGAAKLALANVPSDLQTLLISGAQSNLQTVTFDSAPATDTLTADADTLFFKGSVQAQTQLVLDFLAKYGIKAQILQKDDLQEDMALYLVTTLKNPDLSLMTSAVYNASGKSGDAKRVCAILQAAKVVSCQALNNTANQTGTTIFYKDVKAVATLKRMTEFAKATFQKAGSDQIEDIRVVAGK